MTAVVFLLVCDVGGTDQDVRLYFPIASMIVEANREQTWVHKTLLLDDLLVLLTYDFRHFCPLIVPYSYGNLLILLKN